MPFSDFERDLAARTIAGETVPEDGPAGQAAVASVILNRLNSGNFGKSIQDVVLGRNQFEAWDARRRELKGMSKSSDAYQSAAKVFDAVASGDVPDPTNGAVFYYNPTAQAALGRAVPSFAKDKQPTSIIGHHQFYADNARSTAPATAVTLDDIADTRKMFELPSSGSAMPSSAPMQSGAVTPDDMNETAKMFGLGSAPVMKAPLAAPTDVPQQATPEIRAAAAAVVPRLGFPNAMVEGMPIVGPAFNAATAAANAGVQPLVDPNVPATFSERFNRNLAVQSEAQRLWNEAHGIQAPVANALGAGLLMGPVASTRAGAFALGLPNATRMGATVGGRFYSGAAGGAGIGALDAALRGEDPSTGAVVGGGFGGAGVLAGHALGGIVEGLSNTLRRPPDALAGVNPIGRGWLANALANETPASIAAARARMGPQGFLADINPATTELAAGIANRAEPPGSAAVGEAYRTRKAGQRATVEEALTNAFGPRVDVEQLGKTIASDRALAADPLYKQFRSMQVPVTKELGALVPRLQSVGALDEARYLANASGKPFDLKNPTPETWDLAKRGLDSLIEGAYSAGNKTRAATLVNLKNSLIGEIEKTPAGQVWAQARAAYAEPSQLLDHMAAGKDTFLGARSGLSVDQLREELKGLSGPELAARIIGARDAANDVMGSTAIGDTTLRNKFLAPNNQEKLKLLLGDRRAQELIDTLEQQRYLSEQSKYVNPRAGSPTAPRTAAINALEAPPLPEWNPNIAQPLSFIPPAWLDALRPSTILQGGRQAGYATARQQIVPALLAQGNDLAALLDAIRQEAAGRAASSARGAAARSFGTTAIAGPGSETTRLRGGIRPNALMPGAL